MAEKPADDMTRLLGLVTTLLEKVEALEASFARYEPLLHEAERRLAGPLSFGRRKA